MRDMGLGSLAFQLIAVLVLTLLLLNRYSDWRKQHSLVYFFTAIGWYFSLLIVLILPLDVSITFYKKCLLETASRENTSEYGQDTPVSPTPGTVQNCEPPRGYVGDDVLMILWRVVYWTSQFLTWIMLPVMQSYVRAGEFSTLGRLRYSLYSNMLYYMAGSATLFLLFVYAVSKGVELNYESLKVLVISASNTWGLFLFVLLLGYSLVELPRQLCQAADRHHRLNKVYFDVDKLATEKNDAEDTVQEVYREAKEVMNVLKGARGSAREKAQQIMARFPQQLVQKLAASSTTPNFGRSSNIAESDAAVVGSDTYLIRLHRRTIEAVQNHHRCQIQWKSKISTAFYLEEVGLAEMSGRLPVTWGTAFKKNSSLLERLFRAFPLAEPIRFWWHVTMQRPLLLTLSAICTCMTVITLWSECTFFIVHPRLSIAAQLLHGAAHASHYKYIQIGAIAMLAYLGASAYYTVFRIRIYRYYKIDSHQMTDENSLIFSTMLLCRLTSAICLNFLGMIHLDSHITFHDGLGVETQFTKLMGHLDVLPAIARGINLYLPIVILLLCLGTWFRLGSRLLSYLGVDQFIVDDEMTTDMVQNGKALVTLERNRLNRERGMGERNRAWDGLEGRRVNASHDFFSGRTRLHKSDSDRRPIMGEEQQEESLMERAMKRGPAAGVPSPTPGYSTHRQQPLEDVSSADDADSGRAAPNRVDIYHPTPESIFDDL